MSGKFYDISKIVHCGSTVFVNKLYDINIDPCCWVIFSINSHTEPTPSTEEWKGKMINLSAFELLQVFNSEFYWHNNSKNTKSESEVQNPNPDSFSDSVHHYFTFPIESTNI